MNWHGDKQLKKNKCSYTAFGPNLFQHTIQKLSVAGPLQLFCAHSDDDFLPEAVKYVHRKYKLVWLHLGTCAG